MKLYEFFPKNDKGEPGYGSYFFIMSTDEQSARSLLLDNAEWKEMVDSSGYDLKQMGVSAHEQGEVIRIEMS